MEDEIKRTKLLNSCLNGDGNIFDEIKKMHKSKPVVANSINGMMQISQVILPIFTGNCTTVSMITQNLLRSVKFWKIKSVNLL